jgi:hypothetical protein
MGIRRADPHRAKFLAGCARWESGERIPIAPNPRLAAQDGESAERIPIAPKIPEGPGRFAARPYTRCQR